MEATEFLLNRALYILYWLAELFDLNQGVYILLS